MGRPPTGALGTFDAGLADKVKELRDDNGGWGALTILIEMEEAHTYAKDSLPSVSSINRYLRQEGFIKPLEPAGGFPRPPCTQPMAPHELWEMDAQGAIEVAGIGCCAMINIKDSVSRKHCAALPVPVKNKRSQPSTRHYKWALRLAFAESGLPQRIQVDKDSVFIENISRSPFPSRLHIWLSAMGVELFFIDKRPPAKQAIVERSHQTMERQAVRDKSFSCWGSLARHCDARRQRLNEKMPNRSLGKKAPLQAFPGAAHSGRPYSVGTELSLLDLRRVHALLGEGQWYRVVSSGKMVSLGAQRYYLHCAKPKSQLQITFCQQSALLVFRDAEGGVVAELPLKGCSIEELMGCNASELASLCEKLSTADDCPL